MFGSYQSSPTSLPPELLNEPFTDNDNGLRAEIIVSRPLFLFEISPPLVAVEIAGGNVVCVPANRRPVKWRSNVSIQTVHDTYGLAITLLFMRRLHSLRDKDDRLVYAYLEGSAHALGLMVEMDVVDVILDELVRRQKLSMGITREEMSLVSEVRSLMGGRETQESEWTLEARPDLTPLSLPVEIVALITNSLRISNEVSTLVRLKRASIVPPIRDVIGRARIHSAHTRTTHSRSAHRRLNTGSVHQVSITILVNDCYRLESSKVHSSRPLGSGGLSRRSLYSYHAYYRSRGCNPKLGMTSMLDWLEGQVRTMDMNELHAWTVQLISDMAVVVTARETNTDGMRDVLLSLVKKARKYDFSIRQL